MFQVVGSVFRVQRVRSRVSGFGKVVPPLTEVLEEAVVPEHGFCNTSDFNLGPDGSDLSKKVDIGLSGKENSKSCGARPLKSCRRLGGLRGVCCECRTISLGPGESGRSFLPRQRYKREDMSQSIWSRQFAEPKVVSTQKLANLYQKPSMPT